MKFEEGYNDAELVRKLKNNDEDAMIILYRNYWKTLYISAFKVLKDKEACEDIIQELFINVWNKRQEINIRTSLQQYFLACVRYEVLRKVRESKKYEPIVDELIETASDLSLYESLEYKELQNRLSVAIDMLPTKCREVYQLSRNEYLSHKEISNRLSISTKTVRNHMTKALHHLRISIQQVHMFLLVFIFFK
ncbi:MAG: RNA polymerase sigma factor [Mucilaginibacter sp.]